jgi:hypothetical protein
MVGNSSVSQLLGAGPIDGDRHTRSIIRMRRLSCFALLVFAPALIGTRAFAQSIAPPRPLGAVLATSDAFPAISAVRVLSTGEVLVNDPARRQVVLLDTMLTVRRVVADSTPTTARAYGSRIGGLIGFRGDSTLFVDPGSAAMIVIDQNGQLTRVIAAPSRGGDMNCLLSGTFSSP